MKHIQTIFFALALALSPLAYASTYYASPNGNGNGNSYATPCSFSEGLKKLSLPGDTLYLLGGQYNLGNTKLPSISGDATANIVISGYPGELAILDFRTTSYGTRGLQLTTNNRYIHIKDLTLRYSGKNNLYNEGSYCTFERLDIYGSSDTGCQMKKGGNNLIKNVDSHDNFDYKQMRTGENGEELADFGGNADGFADKQFTGPGNHYVGCRAWNNSDDGWDFYQRVTDGNETIIEDCICFQNGPTSYNMTNHPRYNTDRSWFDNRNGTTITDRYGNTITITMAQYPNLGNGNGFKLGGAKTAHNVLIHHCLSIGNTVKGFDQNSDGGVMKVYNNTALLNGQNYGFYNTECGTLYIRNCVSISSLSENQLTVQRVVADDHNSWSAGFSCTAADFQSMDTSLTLYPRQADGELAITPLMRLQTNSSLIDAGVNVSLPFCNTAPDLGCYESDGNLVIPDPEEPDTTEGPITGLDTIPDGFRKVAFITIPGSQEDVALLHYLLRADSIGIQVRDARDAQVDYSSYDLLVIGPAPKSDAAGFSPLKGYNKPMLVLKPWLFKPSVWNWGTAINTTDLSISVADATHPIFSGLTLSNNQLQLFSSCSSYAVTAMDPWSNCTGITTLASPVSKISASTVAEMPIGANMNGLTLTEPMLMIGVSEYSTANLTDDGKQLILNGIYYMLNMQPRQPEEEEPSTNVTNNSIQRATKIFHNGRLIIIGADGRKYSVLGQIIE